jgi:hypothetical protein
VLHGGGPVSDLIFIPQFVIAIGLLFKWYILYFIYVMF